jgi:hypothetical protein
MPGIVFQECVMDFSEFKPIELPAEAAKPVRDSYTAITAKLSKVTKEQVALHVERHQLRRLGRNADAGSMAKLGKLSARMCELLEEEAMVRTNELLPWFSTLKEEFARLHDVAKLAEKANQESLKASITALGFDTKLLIGGMICGHPSAEAHRQKVREFGNASNGFNEDSGDTHFAPYIENLKLIREINAALHEAQKRIDSAMAQAYLV